MIHPELAKFDTTPAQEDGLNAAYQEALIAATTRTKSLGDFAVELWSQYLDTLVAMKRNSDLLFHIDAYKAAPQDIKDQADEAVQAYRPTGAVRKK